MGSFNLWETQERQVNQSSNYANTFEFSKAASNFQEWRHDIDGHNYRRKGYSNWTTIHDIQGCGTLLSNARDIEGSPYRTMPTVFVVVMYSPSTSRSKELKLLIPRAVTRSSFWTIILDTIQLGKWVRPLRMTAELRIFPTNATGLVQLADSFVSSKKWMTGKKLGRIKVATWLRQNWGVFGKIVRMLIRMLVRQIATPWKVIFLETARRFSSFSIYCTSKTKIGFLI